MELLLPPAAAEPLFHVGSLPITNTMVNSWIAVVFFVVVAFKILPPEVFTIPPKGTLNLHASLLPKYRGAAPINWAIINGEKFTGVTTMLIDRQVDTGGILLQRSQPIPENMTAGELHDILALKGGQLLVETLDALESGAIKPREQEHGQGLVAALRSRGIVCHLQRAN